MKNDSLINKQLCSQLLCETDTFFTDMSNRYQLTDSEILLIIKEYFSLYEFQILYNCESIPKTKTH
jgi:hypothetical protein